MLNMPRIPEIAQRDRFVRRAVSEGRVLTLADEENASVPSQKVAGRTVQLFWSSPIEGQRWAKALAGNRELQDIPLTTFAADILPGIRAAKGLVGTDWVSDPIEAEVDPVDLQIRLKTEAIPAYATATRRRGEVYFAGGDGGPATLPVSRKGMSCQVIQIFPSRPEAERTMKKAGGMLITADPVHNFLAKTLPAAEALGHFVSIEPIAGAGFIDIEAAEFARRLEAVATAP